MASGLDNIPQWKKDLILRKRAQNKYPSADPSAVQLSCVSASIRSEVDSGKIGCAFAPNYLCASGEVEVDKQYLQGDPTVPSQSETVSFVLASRKAVSEQCSEKEGYSNNVISSVSNEDQFQVIQNTENIKMVRDSVLVMQASVTKNITNGECCVDKGAGEESDSSEELQYGPGIVNKLKSKYLSLTLRDTTTKPRPTILNMRRATSLENMLDTDSADDDLLAEHNLNGSGGGDFEETSTGVKRVPLIAVAPTHPRRYISRVPYGERSTNNRNMQNRYRNTTRGNDSIKRARSVETLLRPTSSRESPNEDVVIISNKEGNNNSTSRKHRDNTKTTIPSGDAKSFSSYNSGQRLNRPKRVTPIMDETERPPADHVKQTLMLFEGPPAHRTKPPRPTGDVATKVANFKHIIEHDKQSNKSSVTKKPNIAIKPQISPRPVLSQTEKIRKTQSNTRSPSPKRPLTPNSSDEGMNKEDNKLECAVPESVSPEPVSRSDHIPDVSRIGEACDVSNLNVNVGRLRLTETPDLIVHSSPASSHVHSPTTIKHITTEFIKAEVKCAEIINNKSSLRNEISRSPSPRPSQRSDIPSLGRKKTEDVDGDSAKEITKQAVENIGKAGTSVTYSFSDNANKSHLPRLNTVPVCITRLIPDTPSNKPPLVQQQHTALKKSRPEVNGITTPEYTRSPSPLPSSVKEHHRAVPHLPKVENSTSSFVPSAANVLSPDGNKYMQPDVSRSTSVRPTAPVQNKTLTTREIEKNSINKLKTLEQPVSKVVVSVRNLDEVVVNKNLTGLLNKTSNKPNRTQEQTTILFNFQTRDSIPDYIATDGSSNVRRGKREKPKPGESGIILLPGAPVEEFRTDDEDDWMLSLNGPPSPCDVSFENDNVLIQGKSSISKQPKRQKMHIQFDDRATQLFEYPSEASMLEDTTSTSALPFNVSSSSTSVTGNTSGHPVLMLPGSSLASYTPSKMTVTSDFQLGVTRSTQPAPVVTPPTLAASTVSEATSSTDIDAGPKIQEPEQPLTYSAETNADILF